MRIDKDDYKYYLNLMHEQVRYAETKNSAVIVFSGAFLIGLLNSISSLERLLDFTIFGVSFSFSSELLNQCLFILTFGFLVGIVISFLSFLPKINAKELETLKSKNVLFFDSNTKFKSCIELKRYYDDRYRTENRLVLDYCNQIRNLSVIAKRKYNYFKYSLYPIFFSIIFVVIILIIQLMQGD